MAKKKTSAMAKAQYSMYKDSDRARKNKARRLAKHQRKHPNDAQAAKAVAQGHTRKTPLGRGPAVKETGLIVVGSTKSKNRQGKLVDVPLYKMSVNFNQYRTKAERMVRVGNFFRLGERVQLTQA